MNSDICHTPPPYTPYASRRAYYYIRGSWAGSWSFIAGSWSAEPNSVLLFSPCIRHRFLQLFVAREEYVGARLDTSAIRLCMFLRRNFRIFNNLRKVGIPFRTPYASAKRGLLRKFLYIKKRDKKENIKKKRNLRGNFLFFPFCFHHFAGVLTEGRRE